MLAATDTARIVAALATARGVDLRDYRPQSLARGIAARLAATGAVDAERYAAQLAGDADEASRLLEAIVVPATAFFRDDAVFEALRRTVIPGLVRSQRELVRVWTIGVATGEEAWSIAMLLAEACEAVGRRWELFGTDLEPSALAHAERGEYDDGSLASVPADLRARFMDGGRVGPALRAHVEFEAHNLLGSRRAPTRSVVAAFHLVCLRNVLIYFDRRLQEKALERVETTLAGGGVLVLGPVEILPVALETKLRAYPGLDPTLRVYSRRS